MDVLLEVLSGNLLSQGHASTYHVSIQYYIQSLRVYITMATKRLHASS